MFSDLYAPQDSTFWHIGDNDAFHLTNVGQRPLK